MLFGNRLTFLNSFQASKDSVFCLQVSFLNKLLFWFISSSSIFSLLGDFWKQKSFFLFCFLSSLAWIIWFRSLEFFLAAWQILMQLPFQKIHPCWNLLLRHSSSAPCTCGCLYILLIKECSPSTYQMFYFYIMCLLTPQLLFWTREERIAE